MIESVSLHLVRGLPVIKEGDSLADLIQSRFELLDGDLICIASTVVSKSEGRVRELSSYTPEERALEIAKNLGKDPRFVQAVLEESAQILLDHPFLLVVTRFGHVCVNAGIDQSNVPAGRILLLPENPSLSAERIRRELSRDCPVIITDTCGRPFRFGVAGVAIGWSGLSPIRDWRGAPDIHGRKLEITLEAVADEIAGMANLLMGEAGDSTPVVVVRGLPHFDGDGSVFMPEERDVIRAVLSRCGSRRA
ncbi:MAG TPA: coenzyme F420-0:L-glutamate ligase [Methanothrix sp.]|nr:coenzyme F420-0:L-glutamate ligase [Methanothrix sp.]HOK57582.1 coenzyme F420-0:L-glutamate ligase [Methanothrix sp.]HOL42880.1 coenzyme F420-0:L-glutamate ligase [Methanothrix sp.]HPO87867.1 coenzyme F420-0:L-glutamate ligase [Methanothrix sp.]